MGNKKKSSEMSWCSIWFDRANILLKNQHILSSRTSFGQQTVFNCSTFHFVIVFVTIQYINKPDEIFQFVNLKYKVDLNQSKNNRFNVMSINKVQQKTFNYLLFYIHVRIPRHPCLRMLRNLKINNQIVQFFGQLKVKCFILECHC